MKSSDVSYMVNVGVVSVGDISVVMFMFLVSVIVFF